CPALSLARLEIRNFVTSLLRRARPDDLAISSSRDATAPTLSLGVGARLCRLLTGVLPRFCLLTRVCAASYEVPARDVRLAPAPGPNVALPTSAALPDVPLLVLRAAPHPAVHAVVRGVRALLVERVDAVRAPQLVPAHAGDARKRLARLVGDERLVVLEVPVREPVRRPLPVRQDVEVLRRIHDPRLREAVAGPRCAREDRVERRRRQLGVEAERRGRRRAPMDIEVPDVERVECRPVGSAVVLRP